MRTEYHCHILPGIDDGADSVEMSAKMVEQMKGQGVQRIVATPHFYAHREQSIHSFLQKRQESFETARGQWELTDVRLGAEVAVEQGLSEMEDLKQLAIEGTNLILLELPYRPYAKWMGEEIYNVAREFHLQVILAHVHRYLSFYTKEEIKELFSLDAILQLNNEAFASCFEKRFAKTVLKGYDLFVFGSDAHNLTSRKPNWDLLQRKVSQEALHQSDMVLDLYSV
ncbi:MAG: capsular polysaccharide biosynthesis protein [Clostridia bacterium]|nr:capsular polysaccharide biosynthesis protein [Clostridia bacterium]